MQYVRWYDRKPSLREVFEFIQGLDAVYQEKVAQDIMQILTRDFKIGLDSDINNIALTCNYPLKRWYDKNTDLFTSFEIIKGLSFNTQEEVITKIVETVLFIYMQDEGNV